MNLHVHVCVSFMSKTLSVDMLSYLPVNFCHQRENRSWTGSRKQAMASWHPHLKVQYIWQLSDIKDTHLPLSWTSTVIDAGKLNWQHDIYFYCIMRLTFKCMEDLYSSWRIYGFADGIFYIPGTLYIFAMVNARKSAWSFTFYMSKKYNLLNFMKIENFIKRWNFSHQ